MLRTLNLGGLAKMLLSRKPGGVMLKVGDSAPDFEAQTHTGEQVRLSRLLGSRVVLWFYPKADTPGCTLEGCAFRDQSSAYAQKGVKVFGVSFDTCEENRKFAEKFHFPFALLCDTTRKIGMLYGACDDPKAGYPRRISYVISPEGKIERAFGNVDVRTHAQTLLESL